MAGCRACWSSSNGCRRCRAARRVRAEGIPQEPLREFLEDHGLQACSSGSSAAARQPRAPATSMPSRRASGSRAGRAPPADARSTARLRDRAVDGAARALDRRGAARLVAIDTETSDLDAMRAELTGISMALGPTTPATSRSAMAAATCSPRPVRCRARCSRAEAAARRSGGAQGRAEPQVSTGSSSPRRGIDVAPVDDTMVISFDLDAGALDGHGMDELAERISATTASPSRTCAAPARSRSRSARCRSTRRPSTPPRTPT